MKKTLFFTILLISVFAAANEAGHGGHGWNEHTKQTIIYQCINVAVLFGGLAYFLRGAIKNYFSSKRNEYVAASEKAHAARKAAEAEHAGVQVRLTKLESTAEESVARARAEAADMKAQLISEAQVLSSRIRDEAMSAAKLEVEKAKAQLRTQLIKEATELARGNMSSKVSSEDHQRLQGEFINNIRGVQA
jgi:F-type H+-transporting ATPase subunit b